jgi:hypothetical protein
MLTNRTRYKRGLSRAGFLGVMAIDALEGPDFRSILLRGVQGARNDVSPFETSRALDRFNEISWRGCWFDHKSAPLPYRRERELVAQPLTPGAGALVNDGAIVRLSTVRIERQKTKR